MYFHHVYIMDVNHLKKVDNFGVGMLKVRDDADIVDLR